MTQYHDYELFYTIKLRNSSDLTTTEGVFWNVLANDQTLNDDHLIDFCHSMNSF